MRVGRAARAVLVAIVASACAQTPPTLSPQVAAPPSARVADTIFYVSARARAGGPNERRFADSLEFGYVIHTRRGPADVMTDGLDLTLADSVSLTRRQFTTQLRAASRHTTNDAAGVAFNEDSIALLYVHGYSTSLHECWQNASESRVRSRSAAPWVAFCWPSNGRGIALPKRGALLDRAYREDSAAAVASAPTFRRTVEIVLDGVPADRLLLIAHSMGSQLLDAALSDSSRLSVRLRERPLRAIIFAAADMERSRFTESVVPALRPLTSRLVAYLSGRDRMLMLSGQRSGTARAGLRKREPLAHPDLETIDATDALVAENWIQGIFGTHHAVRRASAVLYDLVHIVGANRTAECRTAVGTAQMSADGVWQLLDVRPDVDAAAERCTDRDVKAR